MRESNHGFKALLVLILGTLTLNCGGVTGQNQNGYLYEANQGSSPTSYSNDEGPQYQTLPSALLPPGGEQYIVDAPEASVSMNTDSLAQLFKDQPTGQSLNDAIVILAPPTQGSYRKQRRRYDDRHNPLHPFATPKKDKLASRSLASFYSATLPAAEKRSEGGEVPATGPLASGMSSLMDWATDKLQERYAPPLSSYLGTSRSDQSRSDIDRSYGGWSGGSLLGGGLLGSLPLHGHYGHHGHYPYLHDHHYGHYGGYHDHHHVRPVFSALGSYIDSIRAWAPRRAVRRGVAKLVANSVRLGGTVAYVGSEAVARGIDYATQGWGWRR